MRLLLAAAFAAIALFLLVPSGAHLLHFDAKAHMVVSRRVIDSLTPGWSQLGAVWLPLPHILNALPAQSDFLYRTALFAALLGAASFTLGVGALSGSVADATRDRRAGFLAATVMLASPGWLYLSSTPLTEPLFLGLVCALVRYVVRFRGSGDPRDLDRASVCSGLACLVRYEAWPIAATMIVLSFWRLPFALTLEARRRLLKRLTFVGLAGPVLFYALHSLLVSGSALLMIEGRNLTDEAGHTALALQRIGTGLVSAFGLPLVLAGIAACAWLAVRREPAALLVLALCSPVAITFIAYLAGHPVKARYALLLTPALAIALAAATRARPVAQTVALLLAATQGAFLPTPEPVLVESTRDEWAVIHRAPGLHALRGEYRGGRILVSLAAGAPLVFDLGLPVREILHEGNEDLWEEALERPAAVAAWAIIYPWDALGERQKQRPGYPEGFVPVRKLGSATLYRRQSEATSPSR